MVASECEPFAKTGGLADVVDALSRALGRLGHEVDVYLPKYRGLEPPGDVHGSTSYRRRVGEAYVRRALTAATGDAGRPR